MEDLAPLATLSGLRRLQLEGTAVRDLAPLRGFAIESLNLSRTSIADLAPLAALSALDTLWLGNTGITDLGALRNASRLARLDLSHTQITDLAPLADLPALEFVDLRVAPASESQLEMLRSRRSELIIVREAPSRAQHPQPEEPLA